MKEIAGFNITEYEWSEVRNSASKVNPKLAEVIDNLNPSSKYKLYEANYQYGDLVLDEGQLMLPIHNGTCISLQNPLVPTFLKHAFSYSSAPIGLILSNSIEVYIESGFDVIPLVILEAGRTLGLLETLDPVGTYCLRHIWSSCAGARSAYMLPKISDKIAHSRLQREFGITHEAPKNYFNHFHVFKEITKKQRENKKPWEMKILFFSEEWFELEPFKNHLRYLMVQNSSYARNKSTFDVLWHFFSKELTQKGRKPNPYVLDTLKHVVKILIGASPGYSPVQAESTRGPFELIKKIYLDIYRLASIPTIMAPYHFTAGIGNSQPVIHSMNHTSMFETIPKMREPESLITDLVQSQSLLKFFYELGKNGNLKIKQTILEKAFEETDLFYYHANPNRNYCGIKNSSELPKEDQRLISHPYSDQSNELKFSDNGEFVKSCILIKNKDV